MVDPVARISTPLTSLLGIAHPILSAPMGDSAGGRLAAAVSGAGGLGLLGGGYADPDWLAAELALAGDARIGIGFITFALSGRPETLDMALAAEPVAIQLSFGDPAPFSARIRDAGCLLICQVQTTEEIDAALAVGADVIVAQGSDAGGHGRAGRATFGLVPPTVDRVGSTPVVAAGGVADGRGLAAALMLGAAGVSMGTRFLVTEEAIAGRSELAALVAAHGDETLRTDGFDVIRGPAWPAGYDGRVVGNDFTRRWAARSGPEAQWRPELEEMFRSSAPDDVSVRPVWGGEGLDLIDSVVPAASIVSNVVGDAARLLGSAGDLLRS